MSLGLKKKYMLSLQQPSGLPRAYQRVEFIQTTGTQYIDTGVKFDFDYTLKARIEFTGTLGDETLMGVRLYEEIYAGYNWKWEHGGINGSTYWQIAFASNWYNVSSPATALNTKYDIESKLSVGSQYLKVNGSTVISQTNSDSSNLAYAKQHNWFIFARSGQNGPGTASNFFKGKLYSFTLTKNDVVVRDYIPCYRKSDGEVGLYDLITRTFYTNQGTGSFSCGASMLPASERETYQQVEYIGNQNTSGSTYLSIPKFPYKLQTKYSSTQVTQTDATLLRTYPAVSSEMLTFLGVNSSKQFRINFANYQNYTSPLTSDNTIFDYTIKLDTSIEATLNGQSYTLSYNGVCSAGRSSLEQFENTSMTVLANRPTAINNNRYWKLYTLRFYDKNYALIGDYVPVYRKSDNEIGLYDLVSKSFYTNEGDGTLAKGNLM